MTSTYISPFFELTRVKHHTATRFAPIVKTLLTSAHFDKLVSKPPSILKNVHPRPGPPRSSLYLVAVGVSAQ